MSDLAERLRRIDAEMTPGPWRMRVTEDGREPRVYVTGLMSDGGREPDTVPPKFYVAFMPQMNPGDSQPDAAAIAALRNALPEIIAALERAAALELEAEADEIDDAAEERVEHAWDGLRSALDAQPVDVERLMVAWREYVDRFADPDDPTRNSSTTIRDAFVAGWDAAALARQEPPE